MTAATTSETVASLGLGTASRRHRRDRFSLTVVLRAWAVLGLWGVGGLDIRRYCCFVLVLEAVGLVGA